MFCVHVAASVHRRVRDWVQRRLRAEGGFILLESMVAISLITVIMGAVGAEYISGLSATSHQRAETVAIQVADTAVENLRALHPSDLLSGRDKASVTAERNTLVAIPAVAPWISTTANQLAYDKTVTTGGANATVSTAATSQKPAQISYSVYDYLECVAASSDGSCISSSGAPNGIRAVVAVVWKQRGCQAGTCSYTTSTLINADSDPTFDLNQALPPAPVITDPGAQTIAVNDVVSLQLYVQNGKGVAPFTWTKSSGTFPTGLNISPDGLISGTVGGSQGTASTTIQVTDAFLRTTTVTISWTIKPPLAATTPGPQANLTTDTVSLPLSASGGEGTPYTWSLVSGAVPPGLTLNATGSITGQPTTPGQYSFRLKVTDKSTTRNVLTGTITWTVSYPPLVGSNPGDQTDTIGTTKTLQLSASGGAGDYVWSDPTNSLAATGLTMDATGKITGTLAAKTADVPVSLVVSSPKSGFTNTVNFTWHVVGKPTIDSPGTDTMTETGIESVPLRYSCPNGQCTVTLSGAPPGLGLDTNATNNASNSTTTLKLNSGSGTIYITGVVSTSAVTTGNSKGYTPTVAIKDADNVSDTHTGSWTVNVAPTLTVAPTATAQSPVQFAPRSAVTGTATASLGSGSYTYALVGAPSWLTINSSTGAISGTAPATRAKVAFTVQATDADKVVASSAVTWYVDDLAWTAITKSTAAPTNGTTKTDTLDLSAFVTGGSGSNTYAIQSPPSWLSLSGKTLTASVKKTTTSATVTVSVTDSVGTTVATSFTWKIT